MSGIAKYRDFLIISGLGIASIIIDANNPTTVKWVRYFYYGVQCFNFFIMFLVHADIKNKNENQKFQYTKVSSTMGAIGEDEVRVISTSIKDYDYKQNAVLLRSSLIMLCILSFLHYAFGWTRILLLQLYLPIKILLIHPMVEVHVLQREAKGNLARPWNMYSKIPASTFGNLITERPVTPKDIKEKKKEEKNTTLEQKAKKMKNRR
ncbi:hypothetical protein BCR36DRAFT_585703 [Piromyces finnis]|uniref:Uncharacterized protein n=1 Tax=Piromyces finnis TaxID=1754191 RepID=A0A1Y1V3B0_9FUNG|nr:hypothetical protein BCR36DRAFT_585703 [Piromyces finnis]|eukprot:ORX45398.1 hypothetical protein BCR36DRAFT_585703 [Piromyces finnis]